MNKELVKEEALKLVRHPEDYIFPSKVLGLSREECSDLYNKKDNAEVYELYQLTTTTCCSSYFCVHNNKPSSVYSCKYDCSHVMALYDVKCGSSSNEELINMFRLCDKMHEKAVRILLTHTMHRGLEIPPPLSKVYNRLLTIPHAVDLLNELEEKGYLLAPYPVDFESVCVTSLIWLLDTKPGTHPGEVFMPDIHDYNIKLAHAALWIVHGHKPDNYTFHEILNHMTDVTEETLGKYTYELLTNFLVEGLSSRQYILNTDYLSIVDFLYSTRPLDIIAKSGIELTEIAYWLVRKCTDNYCEIDMNYWLLYFRKRQALPMKEYLYNYSLLENLENIDPRVAMYVFRGRKRKVSTQAVINTFPPFTSSPDVVTLVMIDTDTGYCEEVALHMYLEYLADVSEYIRGKLSFDKYKGGEQKRQKREFKIEIDIPDPLESVQDYITYAYTGYLPPDSGDCHETASRLAKLKAVAEFMGSPQCVQHIEKLMVDSYITDFEHHKSCSYEDCDIIRNLTDTRKPFEANEHVEPEAYKDGYGSSSGFDSHETEYSESDDED
jgi:hypothetical protein